MNILKTTFNSIYKPRLSDQRYDELKKSEVFLQSIIENIPDIVFVKEAKNLRYIQFNKAGRQAIGRSMPEVIGKTDNELFPPHQAAHFIETDREVLSSLKKISIDEEQVSSMGQQKVMRTQKIPILGQSGKGEYILGISEDITDHLNAQKRKLDIEKLNQISLAKSELMANISHEIRNPLGAIIGFANLGKCDTAADSKLHKYFNTIAHSGEDLQQLVSEVLDFSESESKKMEAELKETNLHNALSSLENLLSIKAEEKNLDLDIDYSCLKNRVFITDQLKLKQILTNLLCNALKFTNKGIVSLKVTEKLSNTKLYLDFMVSDTGIGISPERQSQLFTPFEQIDKSIRKQYGGTGLGLYLSKKLTNILGAELRLIKSDKNQGTSFLLSLPVTEAMHSRKLDVVNTKANVSGIKPYKIHVLIVDDSEDNRILVSAYLENLGVSYEIAENGKQALEKMHNNDYDYVFMDVQMPIMDGLTAVSEARRLGYTKPVIALTAQDMKNNLKSFIQQGFDNYLSKPLSLEALHNFMFQNLNRA